MYWAKCDQARTCRNDDPLSEVEQQDYYYRNGIHVKDVIDQVYQFFGDDLTSWEAAGIYNIMKYLMRYKYKENPQKDLDKIAVNVEWLKSEFNKN